MEVEVGKQVEEMLGDLVVVAGRAEVSALAIDDLKGDTTSSGGDDGDTCVDGLGNLDFEAFTSRELESDVGIIQESVQNCKCEDQNDFLSVKKSRLTLVTWGNPHDNNILGVLLILGSNQVENLVIDNTGVGVIDGTVSTDQELRSLSFFNLSARGEEFAELGVRLENVGDTLGGVESGNLDDVSTAGPSELVHLLFDAHAPELAHIELRVPDAELLVQTIEPIGSSTKEGESFDGNRVRDEVPHRVADEEIRMLDVIPEVVPDFLLGGSFFVDEVATDLDVGTVDDGEVWTGLLDQRDQAWHLGIV